MRRISTLAIAMFALVISQNVSGQTTCTPVTTTGTPANYTSSGAAFTFTQGATTVYTSPIFYSNTAQTTIEFYLTLARATGGNTPDLTPTVSVRRGNPVVAQTCAAGAVFSVTNVAATNYYFSITPATPIPAGSNFEIRISIVNTSNNRDATLSAFGIENSITLAPGGAALPVRISSIAVSKEGSGAKLIWNVDTEENVANYQIERSSNGNSFSKIGTVNAAGARSYSFTDNTPLTEGYYRVKAVDHDGKYGLSTIVRLKGGKSGIVLRAYPSPAQNNVTIQHGTAASASRISISSQDGRLVKSIIPSAGAQQTSVDLSAMQAGMYLVRFDSGNGETETLKIVKQ